MTYVAADKYQVKGLQLAASAKMKHIINSDMELDSFDGHNPEGSILDFLEALRIIVANTSTHDKLARKVMVEACTLNLQFIHRRPALVSLLRESVDLGADIIGHRDLEYGLSGGWSCDGGCDDTDRFSAACEACGLHFNNDSPGGTAMRICGLVSAGFTPFPCAQSAVMVSSGGLDGFGELSLLRMKRGGSGDIIAGASSTIKLSPS